VGTDRKASLSSDLTPGSPPSRPVLDFACRPAALTVLVIQRIPIVIVGVATHPYSNMLHCLFVWPLLAAWPLLATASLRPEAIQDLCKQGPLGYVEIKTLRSQ
jgi:hypothetical protein